MTDLGIKACFFQLLPDRSAHRRLYAVTLDVIAQRVVNEGLVVAAPHFMNLLAEVIENFVVQPDRDPGLVQVILTTAGQIENLAAAKALLASMRSRCLVSPSGR
jgi:hypothetical protein